MHRPPRRRQEERSEATQARILAAAIECLSKLGYSATTTVAVGEHAGVSRGALLHHFPTRAELIAAAVRRLFEELDERFRKAFAQVSADEDRIDAAVELIWKGYASPKVPPLLELFVAARTDARFRSALAPVAREHRNRLRQLVVESLVDGPPSKEFEGTLTLAFDAMQGMAIRRIVQPSAVSETLTAIKALLHGALS